MNKLSIIIPAHNEEGSIQETIFSFHKELDKENINHEILVVNDHSDDKTEDMLIALREQISALRYVNNDMPKGFGFAVRMGLKNFDGDCAAVVMADLSDSPVDLVTYYRKMEEGYDCVFGSRFIKRGHVTGYPFIKYCLNRLTNNFIKFLFGIRYNDVTNAFKLYKKETLEGLKPLFSHHYNLTVELPLKAIVRGFSYAIVPNRWTNRKTGQSKLKIKEMGSRYFFIIFYCFLEKWLARGDYQKNNKF